MSLITLSFSSRMLGIVCFSLLLLPAMVFAENYSVKVDNKTMTIMLNPNYTITVKPNNTIIVQQPTISNTQGDKPNNSLVTYDQIFGGSAIIAGLFSVGLFATTRFSEATKSVSAPLLQASITISGMIISMHILVMLVLVMGLIFNTTFYFAVMGTTIMSVFAISGFIGKIVMIENRIIRKITTTNEDIDKKFHV